MFLPDYLMDEILEEDGSQNSEDMHEFRPSMLYMEQMLRVMPREITCRWKLLPAFEESLMRIDDARNQDIHKVWEWDNHCLVCLSLINSDSTSILICFSYCNSRSVYSNLSLVD